MSVVLVVHKRASLYTSVCCHWAFSNTIILFQKESPGGRERAGRSEDGQKAWNGPCSHSTVNLVANTRRRRARRRRPRCNWTRANAARSPLPPGLTAQWPRGTSSSLPGRVHSYVMRLRQTGGRVRWGQRRMDKQAQGGGKRDRT